MRNFNDLFEELKTEKIETKTLREIVEKFVRGTPEINKNKQNNGNFPAIVSGDIFSSNIYIDECKYFVDETKLKKLPIVEPGDIVMAWMGFTAKHRKGFCLFNGNYKALIGNNTYILKHSQDPKYFSFALDAENVEQQMELSFKTGFSSVLFLLLHDIKKLKVPVPGLDVQRKIGFFLFIFIEYEKFLKKELERRRKQFHFFKELTFDIEIEKPDWRFETVEDIVNEIYSGNDVTKTQLDSGDFPAIRIKEIYHSNLKIKDCINFVDPGLIKRKKYAEPGDILLASASENLRDFGKACVYLGKRDCLVGNDIKIIKHSQNPNYLAYLFSTKKFQEEIKYCSKGANVLHLDSNKFKRIQIPLPPLDEQERIVEILDKFYDLSENPEEGINRLIELNRRQYEYYRDIIFEIMKI